MAHAVAKPLDHELAWAREDGRSREVTREATREATTTSTPARATTTEERLAVVEAAHVTRAELAQVENRLVWWVIGAAATVLISVAGITFALHSSTNARIDSTNVRIESAIDGLRAETNARIDSAVADLKADNRETNARLDQVNQRLDRVIEMMDAKFNMMMTELRAQRRE